MEINFESLEEVNSYIEFLEMKGKPIPQSVLDAKRELERLDSLSDDEYIYGKMSAKNKFMTPAKDKMIREMADQLMMDGPKANQPCLLLGKVQCGKTDSFLGIMSLCFDKGIDVAIVMTKGTNTLTTQTINRLTDEFAIFEDNHTYNQRAIVSIRDIMKIHYNGFTDYQLSDPANKLIIVCKKEVTNLTYLKEMFEQSEILRNKKVLVCDDEADFASRAYYLRKKEFSLMKIGELIEDFIKLPKYCRYLQITATPYSLYLQPDGTIMLRGGKEASPWLPRYTGIVPIHDRYIGGDVYFNQSQNENSMYSCLFQEVTDKCNAILSGRNDWYLESNAHSEDLSPLVYAVISYFFAAAIRSIQVKKKENRRYYSSCLIHCEIAMKNHRWQEDLILAIIDEVKKAFLDRNNADLHILDIESYAYDSLKLSNELGNEEGLIHEKFPTFGEIEAEVKRILQYNDYKVNVVNSEEPGSVESLLNDKGQLRLDQTVNIFIGGSILDRGITIDNMLCFFYGRDPRKFQMDTVLQHARMYGARDKEDMACTRFFTTADIYDALKTINDIDEYLYDYLRGHIDSVQSDDFISTVIGYDSRLKPSATNKYTPANVKVVKPKQRQVPAGFQTGTNEEISGTVAKIDKLIQSCPDFVNAEANGSFFKMDVETAAKIMYLIAETYRYGEEYSNVGYEWYPNEMATTLDHCTFGGDGYIWCYYKTGREMPREKNASTPFNRKWITAPAGQGDIDACKAMSKDIPVLLLLKQKGDEAQGWRNAEFYWPLFMVQEHINAGMFTVNDKKKFRDAKKQISLDTIGDYPEGDILHLQIAKDDFFDIILGNLDRIGQPVLARTWSRLLEKDFLGKPIRIEGFDPGEYDDLGYKNDGIFPYEIRQYKYVALKTSIDKSGSQMLIKLRDEDPIMTDFAPYTQEDIHYDAETGEGEDATDDRYCDWSIYYYVGEILEQKLTDEDKEGIKYYEEYQKQLAAQREAERQQAEAAEQSLYDSIQIDESDVEFIDLM